MFRTLPFVLVILLYTQSVWAAGNPEAGLDIAKLWCSECHVIEADPTMRAVDAAPPFTWIANHPDRSGSYLRAWLFNPHPPMPNLELGRRQIEDLVAYIESLRRQ